MRAALPLLVLVVILAGCGTGGRVTGGDANAGKVVFTKNCASCHTLAAAGSTGTIGPNLDDAFAEARKEGYKQSAIEDIVAGQIRNPGQYATGTSVQYLQANMPPNLVSGQELADVAAFVAANAGVTGFTEQVAVTGTNGETIFKAKCGSCHTLASAGTTGTVGPNLDQLKPSLATVIRQDTNGGAVMPPFKNVLTAAQIRAVAEYVSTHAGK
ncbi:MAG TPA: c-type cytochrome [Gaiellaceae bacterium]|nr:c-type cytochrome [Gaiellaceae bacterium]